MVAAALPSMAILPACLGSNLPLALLLLLAIVLVVRFFWGGVMFGFPFHVPGAAMRYTALALLAHALFQKLM